MTIATWNSKPQHDNPGTHGIRNAFSLLLSSLLLLLVLESLLLLSLSMCCMLHVNH